MIEYLPHFGAHEILSGLIILAIAAMLYGIWRTTIIIERESAPMVVAFFRDRQDNGAQKLTVMNVGRRTVRNLRLQFDDETESAWDNIPPDARFIPRCKAGKEYTFTAGYRMQDVPRRHAVLTVSGTVKRRPWSARTNVIFGEIEEGTDD